MWLGRISLLGYSKNRQYVFVIRFSQLSKAFIITSAHFFCLSSVRRRLASYDFSFVQIGSLRHFSPPLLLPHSAESHVPSNSNWANNTNVYYVSCHVFGPMPAINGIITQSWATYNFRWCIWLFRLFVRAHTRRVREYGFLCSPLDPLACSDLCILMCSAPTNEIFIPRALCLPDRLAALLLSSSSSIGVGPSSFHWSIKRQ